MGFESWRGLYSNPLVIVEILTSLIRYHPAVLRSWLTSFQTYNKLSFRKSRPLLSQNLPSYKIHLLVPTLFCSIFSMIAFVRLRQLSKVSIPISLLQVTFSYTVLVAFLWM